jgi:hypothetical protein
MDHDWRGIAEYLIWAISQLANLTAAQPNADTQPIMATATAVKYPITKTRFNMVSLLTVEPTGINWVRLFMATLLRSSYAGCRRPELQLGSTTR